MNDFIADLVKEISAQRRALIDTACESAIQRGGHGVLVVEGGIDYFRVEVSPLVPPAHVFQFPSEEAVDNWIGHGMPR